MDYLRNQAITAFWVFLSPLSGLWWAMGKTYPLFDNGLRGREAW